jgi:putative ABC transport system ATP-binding protein
VQLQSIGRRFPSEPPVDALVGVDLEIFTGEYLAIVGPSGSGKSTLLNLLGLLDRPTSGRYLLDGLNTTSMSDAQRTAQRARRIGFVFQSFHLLSHRTIEENVSLGELYQGKARRGRNDRARAVLSRVGLSHRFGFTPQRLSGGERQRVAIARSIVATPSLLLCDEPTGNLDSRTSAAILDLFDDLRADGLTVVLITHDPTVAERADRQVRIVDGVLTETSAAARGR